MKRTLYAIAFTALAAMPASASTSFPIVCDFGLSQDEGGLVMMQLFVDQPVGSAWFQEYPDQVEPVVWSEFNGTTAIIDQDDGRLFMLFTGTEGYMPYDHEPGAYDWIPGTCRVGTE